MALGLGAAILGSAVVGGLGSAAAGKARADAADAGAAAQLEATEKTIAEQRRQYDTTREDFKPWREAGKDALAKLQTGIEDGSFTMDDFEFKEDPGYQFRLEQGQKALDNTAAARGNLLSGRQIKNALTYNQGMASDEYGRAYARERDERVGKFNRLSSVAGTGQQATGSTAAAGQQSAGAIGNALMAGGRAQADAAYRRGDAYADMYSNIATSANQGIENALLYKMMG